jgi:hypothetical protein
MPRRFSSLTVSFPSPNFRSLINENILGKCFRREFPTSRCGKSKSAIDTWAEPLYSAGLSLEILCSLVVRNWTLHARGSILFGFLSSRLLEIAYFFWIAFIRMTVYTYIEHLNWPSVNQEFGCCSVSQAGRTV